MDYQYQNAGYVEAPQDYKVWSIINIVFGVLCCGCCGIFGLVLGIMALLKSNDVSKYVAMGEEGLVQAQEASGKAKTYNIIASIFVGLSVIVNILYLILYATGALN
ncbi:MAG: CD225/dispanin family protein [Prevotella sp.]|nr:CD225/dispanin family protein [Prevotella sp.]